MLRVLFSLLLRVLILLNIKYFKGLQSKKQKKDLKFLSSASSCFGPKNCYQLVIAHQIRTCSIFLSQVTLCPCSLFCLFLFLLLLVLFNYYWFCLCGSSSVARQTILLIAFSLEQLQVIQSQVKIFWNSDFTRLYEAIQWHIFNYET